jgi:GPH family glycoside/pentoside/hexuronide:cation symporter
MLAASFGTFSISAAGFPIVLFFGSGNESTGFLFLGLISGSIAILILAITVYFVKERTFDPVNQVNANFKLIAKSVSQNYPFWIVFSSILILGSTALMFNNNLIYFVKYSLDLHAYQGLILGTSGGFTLLAIPFWALLALRLGKRNSWLIAMVWLLIGFLAFYFYPTQSLSELLIILAFLGFGNGATGVLFWSMLPDTIEYGEWKTGIRTESSLYGFMTFAQKGAIGISALLLGIILTNIGFIPNETQSQETLDSLKMVMSWVPISGVILSLVMVIFYPINKSFHAKLLKDIAENKMSHEQG